MSPFEAAMIVCFGVSWPVAIWKTLQTKHVHGKSLAFLALVACGYGFGIIHKALHNFDWVIFLYGFNFSMVLTELGLCLIYGSRHKNPQAAAADTLLDDGDKRSSLKQPLLQVISGHDGRAVRSQAETAEALQLEYCRDMRSIG